MAIAAAFSLPLPASASPPRVQPIACPAAVAKVGRAHVWQAVFWAQRKDDFGNPEEILAAPCFTTAASCNAWLYWAQSDWTDRLSVRYCAPGMPYQK
jgi:hypothetical protein